MKKLVLIALVGMIGLTFISINSSQAQSNKKVHVKQKKEKDPPPWAPAHGYRAKTRYVFFKDYDMYYDQQRKIYVYLKNGNWELGASIPAFLQSVDLNAAIKIDIELESDQPEQHFKEHKKLQSKN